MSPLPPPIAPARPAAPRSRPAAAPGGGRRRSLLAWLLLLSGCAGSARVAPDPEVAAPPWLLGARIRFEPAQELHPAAADRPGQRLGPRLVLRGRLERPGRSRPWPPGPLWLLLAVEPETVPDWEQPAGERWMRQHDSPRGIRFGAGRHVELECELGSDGALQASLPARLLARRVGEPGSHALGLAWSDATGRTRPLPGPSAEVWLPAAARSTPELEAVAAVVAPDQGQFDPLALVRALNRLRALGPEGALACLEAYLERLGSEPVWPPVEPRPGRPETGSPGAVWLIVPQLFEPRPGSPACPPFRLGALQPRPLPPLAGWPDYPLLWIDGWPFLYGDFAEQPTGPSSDPRLALDWAREHGRMRALRITPGSAVLPLLAELEARTALPAGARPRLQVYRALAAVLGLPAAPPWPAPAGFESGPDWLALEAALGARPLRFDPLAQAFVAEAP